MATEKFDTPFGTTYFFPTMFRMSTNYQAFKILLYYNHTHLVTPPIDALPFTSHNQARMTGIAAVQ
jgi:hypothetical protein